MFNRAMLSLAEISDRLEIQQLIADYSTAIDTRRFDDLDAVFTPDAYIDYTALGGIEGPYPEVKAWLAEVLPNFPMSPRIRGPLRSASTATPRRRARSASTRWCWGGEQRPDHVLRAVVRRRVHPDSRRLADDPPGRNQVLPENPLTAVLAEVDF